MKKFLSGTNETTHKSSSRPSNVYRIFCYIEIALLIIFH